MEITSRCLNNIFGYCAQNKTGRQISSPNGEVSYIGYGTACKEKWQECKDHVKYTDIVKPDVPKMEEPVEPKKKKEKVTK
jgi:hypothetical protein